VNFKKILIFRIGHLGDTVVALPAFWRIRQAFPEAELTLLTNQDTKNKSYVSPRDVLPEKGLVDLWMSYPNNVTAVKALALAAAVRRRQFDAAIYLMPSGRTQRQLLRDRLFFRLAGIQRILGFEYFERNSQREAGNELNGRITEREFLLESLSFIQNSSNDVDSKMDLLLTSSEISKAEKLFENKAGTPDLESGFLLAVAPGGKRSSRIWEERRFAEVVERLVENKGVFPIIFGGPEDRKRGDRLIGHWQTGLNAAGCLTVRESAALLQKCTLYLGNDTGTMHLASAVGVPCVAIFSAADRAGQWEPFGKNNRILRKRVDCEGCGLDVCCYQNMCLDLITADEVYAECASLLENSEIEEKGEVEYKIAT